MVTSIVNNGSSSIPGLSHRSRGSATQNRILERAVQIASVEGLASMSLATLAKASAMSKSGLFAHFRSKEALQIAVIDEADRIFFDSVVAPAQTAPAGIARLQALVEGYVSYCSRAPFDGGCFFAAAVHEFDGREGPVRDRVIQHFETWTKEVRTAAEAAAASGHFQRGMDVDAFLFELAGIGLSANVSIQIGRGAEAVKAQCKTAVASLMERVTAAN